MIDRVEMRKKIEKGARLAIERLVRESAARGESLVVERNGKIQKIPAKELLKTYDKGKQGS